MKQIVLLTGSRGFTGKILTSVLKKNYFKVVSLECDITNVKELNHYTRNIGPDFVIHLAAVSSVEFSDPKKFNSVNVEGTRNLLLSLDNMIKPPKLVVIPSTAYVYGVSEISFLNETSNIEPSNIYGKSKLEVERLCKTFKNFPILITRPFNYTGVGQNIGFLVPKIVDHFRLRKAEIELGNIDIEREFNDVRDICEIYLKLIQKVRYSDTINLCSGNSYSIKKIIGICEKLTNHKINIKSHDNLKRQNDIPKIIGNPNKMFTIINNYKFRNLEDTLKWMLFH